MSKLAQIDLEKAKEHVVRQQLLQEDLAREYDIALQTSFIYSERLADCTRQEGVNAYVNCKDLREKYISIVHDRYRGMLFPEGFEPSSRQISGLIKPLSKST